MESKPSILMVIGQYYPLIGGAERQCQLQAEELVRRGYFVRVVTGRWTKSLHREVINGVEVIRLNNLFLGFRLKRGANLYFCIALFFYLIFHLHKFCIVHIHQALRPAAVSLAALQIIRKPSLIKIANSDQRNDYKVIKYGWENSWDKRLRLDKILIRANIFVAINKQIKKELSEEGIDALKIAEIPNGVKADDFKNKINYSAQDIKRIVYVGRITPHKGIDFLFEALSKISNVHLDIFGKINDEAYWLKQIKDKGLERKVSFRGICLDLSEKLQEYDIFVLPSLTEGMSNALLEAMAVGLPCIITNISANLEIVFDNVFVQDIQMGDFLLEDSAVLVNPADAQGLFKAVNFLSQDARTREKLGRSACLRIRNNFSIQRVMDRYEVLYKLLLDGRA